MWVSVGGNEAVAAEDSRNFFHVNRQLFKRHTLGIAFYIAIASVAGGSSGIQ
jgi:hypothetical protein